MIYFYDPGLQNLVWLIGVISYGLINLCGCLCVILRSDVIYKLLLDANKKVSPKHLAKFRAYYKVHVICSNLYCVIFAISEVICHYYFDRMPEWELFMNVGSQLVRMHVTMMALAQLCNFLLIVRSGYATLQETLRSINFSPKFLLYSRGLRLRAAARTENLLKDLGESIHWAFSEFILFVSYAAFFEVLYMAVYQIFEFKHECHHFFGFFWITYILSVFGAALCSVVSTAEKVSDENNE